MSQGHTITAGLHLGEPREREDHVLHCGLGPAGLQHPSGAFSPTISALGVFFSGYSKILRQDMHGYGKFHCLGFPYL